MYNLTWGTAQPGHLLFLIDQSGSLGDDDAKIVAQCLQESLAEVVAACIDGNVVKNRAFVTVIGYGDKSEVKELKSGWIRDLSKEIVAAQDNGTLIIPAISDGGTPMAEAFRLAKNCIDDSIVSFEEQIKNPKSEEERINAYAAPIVINITDGVPDDVADAEVAAKNITDTVTPDGNVLLFNIHICDFKNSKDFAPIIFPDDMSAVQGNKAGEFLFRISSQLTPSMVTVAKKQFNERTKPNSRGFAVNIDSSMLARLITFCSPVK